MTTLRLITEIINPTGAWETYSIESQETDKPATWWVDNAEVSAEDIGGEVGQPLRVIVQDEDGNELGRVEITAS